MPSSFDGVDLFGSGPHRFEVGPQGQSVVPNFVISLPPPGSTPQGLIELDVSVRGRLVANDESALWALRDAVTAKLTNPVTTGTLIDHHGHSWNSMSFIRFEEQGPTQRGRSVSITYRATFRRFV